MPQLDVPPPALTPPTEVELALELEPGGDSTLLRVFSTLHRRRCRVLEASFDGGAGPCERLTLRLEAPRHYAPRVAYWLSSLVDVRRVVA